MDIPVDQAVTDGYLVTAPALACASGLAGSVLCIVSKVIR